MAMNEVVHVRLPRADYRRQLPARASEARPRRNKKGEP
jgi:hypothetical protein